MKFIAPPRTDAQEILSSAVPDENLCEDPCIYIARMQSIFPMDVTSEIDHPSDLNQFDWKYWYPENVRYIQLYDDHISVVASDDQSEMLPSDPIPNIDT